MKKIFAILLISLCGAISSADENTVAEGLADTPDTVINAFLNFKSQTNQAWVQIQVGEWTSNGEMSWEKAQHVFVDGLTYDSSKKQVIYVAKSGEQIICGTKNIFYSNHLKLTGRCLVEVIHTQATSSVVLNIL